MATYGSIYCFLPPNVLDKMIEAPDAQTRRDAIENKEVAAAARAVRSMYQLMPAMAAIPSGTGGKDRVVYDAQTRRFPLPGQRRRSEGDPPTGDPAVDEAYDYSGDTYDFYRQVLNRRSLDNHDMALVSSVHYGLRINNAFWNGEQMLYGDGDGRFFDRFTKAMDVVAHELTHGVIQFTCNLEYQDEPGALNEHFADSMSAVAKQWKRKQTVEEADWLLGDELMLPGSGIKSLRTFKKEKAFENHPIFGSDLQPKHMRDKYTGTDDNGGVHYNSGIPNHAFYLAAKRIGGYSWDKIGPIWYKAMLSLTQLSNFQEAAGATVLAAGHGTPEEAAIKASWNDVGIRV
jgi:Zn-dependent metalloprotease